MNGCCRSGHRQWIRHGGVGRDRRRRRRDLGVGARTVANTNTSQTPAVGGLVMLQALEIVTGRAAPLAETVTRSSIVTLGSRFHHALNESDGDQLAFHLLRGLTLLVRGDLFVHDAFLIMNQGDLFPNSILVVGVVHTKRRLQTSCRLWSLHNGTARLHFVIHHIKSTDRVSEHDCVRL